MAHSPDEFQGKYQEKNPISRWLVQGFYDRVASLIRNLEAPRVFEVGCGLGYSTRLLSPMVKGADFRASELEADFLPSARERNPGIPITCESVYALDQADESVDLIIALEVLEHLTHPEKALEEMARVTRRYGLFSVPNEPLWRILNMARGAYLSHWGNTPGHLQHWSPHRFKTFISTRFTIKDVRTPLPWTLVLAEKRPDPSPLKRG